MNDECKTCQHTRRCINGAWCTKLGRYVEQALRPPCQDTQENNKPSKNDMEQKTYYLDTGNDRVYFNVIGSETVCRDTTSRVSEDKLITFLQTAQELGLKAGSL